MSNLFYTLGVVTAQAKFAAVTTTLKPHQQRVVSKLTSPTQPGLVVAHGLGSGKTLTAIATQDKLKLPAMVIVPAALQENYAKERKKHLTGRSPEVIITTLQRVARQGSQEPTPLLIIDEAHRIRESGGKAQKAIADTPAQKRMLLTASPFYNRPSDIAALINVAAGEHALPADPTLFKQKYVSEERISPGFVGRLLGATPGIIEKPNPRQIKNLKQVFNKWVDYHADVTDDYPEVTRQTITVPMGSKQRKVYNALIGNAPAWVQYKIKRGLPPSKQESKQLNAFATAIRQISNSTRAHAPSEAPQETKIDHAFSNLKTELESNKNSKAIVYSNYLATGITPYRERLNAAKIPYGEYTGEMKKRDRDALVEDYNSGKKKVILLSSAGGEGLDLKGTRLVQILEPHWNNEKIRQVEGRAIRYKSHTHLPSNERNVRVESYLATLPRAGLLETYKITDPGGGIDEYLTGTAQNKDKLIDQFKELLK